MLQQSVAMQDQILLSNKYSSLFSINMKEKDGSRRSSAHFSGFSKAKNLLVTGHVDGAINFWDASCPLLFPLLSIEQQVFLYWSMYPSCYSIWICIRSWRTFVDQFDSLFWFAFLCQFNESCASSTAPVTSLHFDVSSHILVSGDQSGLVSCLHW